LWVKLWVIVGKKILDTIDHIMFGFFCQGFFVGKLWVKLWVIVGKIVWRGVLFRGVQVWRAAPVQVRDDRR